MSETPTTPPDLPALAAPAVPRAAESALSQPNGHHYGKPLSVKVDGDCLLVEIGIETLAHAARLADWANPWDDEKGDYIRTFEIVDEPEFARDVARAMLREEEDGSSPLSDFLDTVSQAALDDGSTGAEYEKSIPFAVTDAALSPPTGETREER